jgi:putative transposase
MGLETIYPKRKTITPNPAHRIYPYLLRKLCIDHLNQVWESDISYLLMKKGFMYLVTIMDWYSRKVLSCRVSNTMDSDFCVSELKEAIHNYGCPEIFNTDQHGRSWPFPG